MAEHFKYEEMTDEELIDQLREGDRQVMDYICDKYKKSGAKQGKIHVYSGRRQRRSDPGRDDRAVQGSGIMTAAEMPAFIPLQICVSADRCTRQCRLPSA